MQVPAPRTFGPDETPHPSSDAPTLRRSIGPVQLVFYGVGSMLGAGIYGLIGEASRDLGNAVWLAFVVSMIAALLTGLSYANVGSRFPKAAGAAYAAHRAYRTPWLTYIVGLAVVASGLTSMATGSRIIGREINGLVTRYLGEPAPAVAPNTTPATARTNAVSAGVAPNAVPATAQPTPASAADGTASTVVPATAPSEAAGAATSLTPPATSAANASLKPATSAPARTPLFNDRVAVPAFAILFLCSVGLVVFWGIRESMALNIVCTTVEAGGLLFIIAVGARHWGDANLLTGPVDPVTGDFRALSIGVVLGGAVLTFFSFIGFEDILNVSEECKKPQTTVPIGLVGAMLIATVMYMLVAITAVSVLPDGQLAGKRLTDVAAKAAPWFPPALFSLITIFAVANTALLNCVMGSRLLYGMARQGLLPRPLAHVHRGRQTPWVAVAVMVAIVVTLMLIGQLDDLANATVLLLLTVFSIVNVGLIIVKLRPSEPRGSFEVPLFVPALGAVVCLILLATRLVRRDAQGHWDWEAPAIAAGLVALILVLYATLRPKNVIYDEEPAAG